MSAPRKPNNATSIDEDLRAIAYKMAEKGIRRMERIMFENQQITIMLGQDAISQFRDDWAEVWRIRT